MSVMDHEILPAHSSSGLSLLHSIQAQINQEGQHVQKGLMVSDNTECAYFWQRKLLK